MSRFELAEGRLTLRKQGLRPLSAAQCGRIEAATVCAAPPQTRASR